jgi:ribosome-binding factor A|tara:strand:+ start:217 stop:612 length:396 start_codon:yes stop_codon:yes gene_type:complete
MGNQTSHRQYSQRQLRVGELVKQNLGELLIRNEAKIPLINSKLITVTEVKMTPDLKTARVYVIPLGGIDTKETVKILTDYSHLVRKALAKRLDIKFLPKLTFVEDNSFEYAEKIERIIKKNKVNDEKKRYN